MRRRTLSGLLLLLILGGCDAASNTNVKGESIVQLPARYNLLQSLAVTASNGGWQIIVPRSVSTTLRRLNGQAVLTIAGPRRPVQGAVVVAQQAMLLPETAAGSAYILRERIRTTTLSRPVRIELKLSYVGGGYQFFGAAPVSPGAAEGIRGTTEGWVTVEVRATAALPVVSVVVYAADSLPVPRFQGSLSIEDPQLYTIAGGALASRHQQ